MAGVSGKKLDDIYKLAWVRGLKTTYYLRSMGATSAEKSTGRGGELNAVSMGESSHVAAAAATPAVAAPPKPEKLGVACTMPPGAEGTSDKRREGKGGGRVGRYRGGP